MADEQFEVESAIPEIEFEFNGDLLTIIYGCLYGVLLIILFVYMYILKKKKGLDGNIFGMVYVLYYKPLIYYNLSYIILGMGDAGFDNDGDIPYIRYWF